jgi:serine/threonine-protein kinase
MWTTISNLHPSPELLLAFSQGQAPPAETELISTHLSDCPPCCSLLDQFQADDPLLTRLRQAAHGTHETGEQDARHHAVRALRRRRPPGADDSADRTQGGAPQALPTVAGYEVLEEVGRGGMGVVYKARHLALNRLVALKMILAAHLSSAAGHARLRLEAELAARIQHPNIVQVHEVGSHPDGPFLGLEWVDGGTLADRLAEPWPAACAAALVKTLARAVHAAHAQGVIHRDLKPANVLLQELPPDEAAAGAVSLPGGALVVPKLADFGLALLVEGGEQLTGTGQVVGTPAYMAPEQARGERARVGPATDVHALGVILYQLLTGRVPFPGDDPVQVLLAVTTTEPPPPRRLRPQVPRDLETVCLKCLEKEPADRYPSAGALADDLGNFLEDRPVQARRPSVVQVAARWARRHRAVVWSAALAALVGLAVLAGSAGWVVRDRAARQARATTEAREALSQAAALREEARQAGGDSGKWAEARAMARRAETLVEGGRAAPGLAEEVADLIRELDAEQADRGLVDRLDRAPLLQAEVDVKENVFLLRRALPEYRQAFADYGLRPASTAPAEAAARLRRRPAAVREAAVAGLDSWLDLAREEKEDEVGWLEQVLAVADPDDWRQRLRVARGRRDRQALQALAGEVKVASQRPQSLVLLYRGLRVSGALEDAVKMLERAQQAYPGDFWINHHLGKSYYDSRPPRLDEAIRFRTAAVALRPRSAGARLNLGAALEGRGRLDEAITAYRQAIDLRADYAQAHYNLVRAMARKGQLDDVVASYRKDTKLHPDSAVAHQCLGIALKQKGDAAGAAASYRRALAIDPKVAWAHNELGNALQYLGDLPGAVASFRRAAALAPKVASPRYNLGNALWLSGDLPGAATSFRRVLEIDPKHAEAHCNLGHVLMRQGALSRALAELRRGHDLGARQKGWPNPSRQWIQKCECLIELDRRLPAILKGQEKPAGAAECLDLADLCHYKGLYASSVRFFTEAFAADARLADDFQARHRFRAACSAALAGRSRGEEAARMRGQALAWLRADLARGATLEPIVLQMALARWKIESGLAGVRDAAGLAALPAAERAAWEKLWAEVGAALSKGDAK